ncbi:MAG: RecX family transcriptional regulator [Rothia sp.]|uniref:RecX family transcriptional regulator n=1 Tax=Rothia sp. (in: high G+C Gram-positive bacteria) TaxID=1885016 RepID=UPI001CB48C34|nr:RecX family transcriptional regulator [Rothia sp. (in: high G+C Gram-positive bacteria)]MBF1680158.1 RecX family transcriptional regulator [Rothia sp. (in: high G+C Gram-positive bacteria)]
MTEQNGHKEREQNSARDGDAGFAALDATEPHFGSSALQGSAFESSDFSAPVSFEPVAPPVEVSGFEALSFEAPAPLAEPTLNWKVPQTTPPAVLEPAPAVPQTVEPPYADEPSYSDEPPYPEEPPYEDEPPYLDEPPYPEAEYAGWVPADEAAPAEAEKPASPKTSPQKPAQKAQQPEKPAPKKWARNRAADPVVAEEFPDWHPAAHGFVEESIARDTGNDYAGEFRVPELPLQAVPANSEGGDSEEDGESPRRSLLVDPNLPAVSIDEAPQRAFTPGGAEPRPMAAGRMSRAGAASIGSGLTAEEKEEIERQAAQRDKQKKRKSSRASKNTDYKRGFRRMSAAQEEKMRSRSPYAPAFGVRSDDEETRNSTTRRGSGSNLFREGSALNEELTPAEEALIRGIAEEEAQGVGTGKRRAASGNSRAHGSQPGSSQRGKASSQAESNVPSWKQKVRAARAAEETDPYTRAKTIVYNQLAYSAKTRGQLRKKLQAGGFEAELIEPLLDKFEAAKLIDDAEYAQTFVAQKSRTKKLSRAALRRELAERGVRGEEAENALAQRTDEQEREDAAELVRKKLRPGMDLSDRAEKDKVTRRLLGMLARRGYSSSVSMSVIREELAAYGAEDELW